MTIRPTIFDPLSRIGVRVGFWRVMAALAMLSAPLHFPAVASDVSWLLFVCRRMIEGAVVYIDVVESAVPVAILLYFPAAAAARFSGVDAAIMVIVFAYTAAFLSFALARAILPRQLQHVGSSDMAFLLPSALFLFVVADNSFAQREFFAAAFSLPMVSIMIRNWSDGSWPLAATRIPAAALAGIAAAIKPPIFALPFLMLGVILIVRHRRVSALARSGLVESALFAAVITVASLALMPTYITSALPMMRELYLEIRVPPLVLVKIVSFIGGASLIAMTLIVASRSKATGLVVIIVSVAAGFLVAYVVQGKYWSYQLLPAAMYSIIGIICAALARYRASPPEQARDPVFAAISCGVALFSVGMIAHDFVDNAARMNDRSWAKQFKRPTVAGLSAYMSIPFPLVEEIDAEWVDPLHSQWPAVYGQLGLQLYPQDAARRARFQAQIDSEFDRVGRLIRGKRPDLLIVNTRESDRWVYDGAIARDPDLLSNYEPIAEESYWLILRRRQPVAEIAR